MSKKLFWNLILAIILVITLVMAKRAYSKFYSYKRLKQTTHACIDNWDITQENDKDKFYLSANYHFDKGEECLFGKTSFTNPLYLNTWSAKTAKDELSKKEWKVFYNPLNPMENSLERVFPYKEIIQFFLTLTLLTYFMVLKRYVSKKQNISTNSLK